MAPTPFSAGGRMVFQLTVSGVIHELHYAAQPVIDAGLPLGYGLVGNDVGATHLDPQTSAEGWWAAVEGFYPSAVSDPGWVLEQNFSGVFVPVAAGGVVGAGTGGGTVVLAAISTLTFKDASNKRVNFELPETSLAVPARGVLSTDPGVAGTFAASVLDQTLGADTIGGWVRSRGNDEVVLSRYISNTISKRLRRIRNFL